jgi:hypothetical protein
MVDASNSAAVVRSLIVPGKASWRSCGGGRAAGERAVNRRCSVESSFFSRLDHSIRCIVLLSGRQTNVCELGDRCRGCRVVRWWRRAQIVAQLPRQIHHRENHTLDHLYLDSLNTMPGKPVSPITAQSCRRCKENAAVLVVRTEPLCRSVIFPQNITIRCY